MRREAITAPGMRYLGYDTLKVSTRVPPITVASEVQIKIA